MRVSNWRTISCWYVYFVCILTNQHEANERLGTLVLLCTENATLHGTDYKGCFGNSKDSITNQRLLTLKRREYATINQVHISAVHFPLPFHSASRSGYHERNFSDQRSIPLPQRTFPHHHGIDLSAFPQRAAWLFPRRRSNEAAEFSGRSGYVSGPDGFGAARRESGSFRLESVVYRERSAGGPAERHEPKRLAQRREDSRAFGAERDAAAGVGRRIDG